MKAINNYITEKLVIGNNLDKGYNYFPKDKDELIECIKDKIEKEGLGTKDKPLDLNDIDTSKVTDMCFLFATGKYSKYKTGYVDVSDWNVSNVTNMAYMFDGSTFDGDLSDWDVHNVKNMNSMFANSDFSGKNGSINNWDVSNVRSMESMFEHCMSFDSDISKWNVKSLKSTQHIFYMCPLELHPPKWYKR